MDRLRGTWFVLPTPFHGDRTLDLDGQRSLVDAAISWGVHGLVAMGVTGEAVALTEAERAAALAAVAETAAGRLPLVVGCSGGSVEVVVDLARRAADAGAVAALVSAPPLHGDVETLPRFYEMAADRAPLPLVVQDEPAATGVSIPTEVLVRCIDAAEARTVKLEDPPTPPKIGAILAARPHLDVFGGLGGVSALEELRAGSGGTMTGFAFPEVLRAVRDATEAGDAARATAVFSRYLPLIRFEAQPGIGLAIRKELLRRRGAIRSAVTRRTAPLTEYVARGLDSVVAEVGIEPALDPLTVE
jgi:4-hydroxy-tetrahydrodipicolinate synthase